MTENLYNRYLDGNTHPADAMARLYRDIKALEVVKQRLRAEMIKNPKQRVGKEHEVIVEDYKVTKLDAGKVMQFVDDLRLVTVKTDHVRVTVHKIGEFVPKAQNKGVDLPDPVRAMTVDEIALLQRAVQQCEDVRANSQSRKWVGNIMAQILQVDPSNPDNRAALARTARRLVNEGILQTQRIYDKRQGREVDAIIAGSPVEAAQ